MTISEQQDKLLEIIGLLDELKSSSITSLSDGPYLIDESIRNCNILLDELSEECSTEDDERHEERERDLMAYYQER